MTAKRKISSSARKKPGIETPKSASPSPPSRAAEPRPRRRDDPDRDRDAEREQQRQHAQLERRLEPLADRLDDRLVGADRAAEVALGGAAEPVAVLDVDRPVEAELGRSRASVSGSADSPAITTAASPGVRWIEREDGQAVTSSKTGTIAARRWTR